MKAISLQIAFCNNIYISLHLFAPPLQEIFIRVRNKRERPKSQNLITSSALLEGIKLNSFIVIFIIRITAIVYRLVSLHICWKYTLCRRAAMPSPEKPAFRVSTKCRSSGPETENYDFSTMLRTEQEQQLYSWLHYMHY